MNKLQTFNKLLDAVDNTLSNATEGDLEALVNAVLDDYTLEFVG